jgi:hypothetical protein
VLRGNDVQHDQPGLLEGCLYQLRHQGSGVLRGVILPGQPDLRRDQRHVHMRRRRSSMLQRDHLQLGGAGLHRRDVPGLRHPEQRLL